MRLILTFDEPLSIVPRRGLCGAAFGLTATGFDGGFGGSGLRSV